jgi:SAM-dependent methyltransferase
MLASDMSRKEHWDNVYSTKGDADVSWTQPEPATSLSLIADACRSGRVVDVGGGTSLPVDRLLDNGYSVGVLDTSDAALTRAGVRLGQRASDVRWFAADVTAGPDLGEFDVWHDRAVFHFLTRPEDRAAYAALLLRTIPTGGHAVVATFAPDGPEKCSGLPVCRYDGPALAEALAAGGANLSLLRTVPETHLTPWGKPQSFQYSLLRRT